MPKKKRSKRSSIFDTIHQLESEDVRASDRKRKRSSKQLRKAKAAQSQIRLFEILTECRILMQQATAANFSEDEWNELLSMLLQARALLNDDSDASNDNYDEIVSTTDGKLDEVLLSEYETHQDEWKEVLNRRHKDVRLHAGLTAKAQFKVMDASFWETVEATVAHEKLRRENTGSDDHNDKFDDSKVYQHLLQDFLAGKQQQSGAACPRATRKKSKQRKKEVDRKASKGRKIRYNEIPKLVNFTFPVARPQPPMDTDEWFGSLFGGAARPVS